MKNDTRDVIKVTMEAVVGLLVLAYLVDVIDKPDPEPVEPYYGVMPYYLNNYEDRIKDQVEQEMYERDLEERYKPYSPWPGESW
jgi:hypothetical protein